MNFNFLLNLFMLVDKFNISYLIENNKIYIFGNKPNIINDILYNIHPAYPIGYIYTTSNNPFYNFVSTDLIHSNLNINLYKNTNCKKTFLIVDNLIINTNYIPDLSSDTFFIFKLPIILQYNIHIDFLFITDYIDTDVKYLYDFLIQQKFHFDIPFHLFEQLLSIIISQNECLIINLHDGHLYWYKYTFYIDFYINNYLTIIDRFINLIHPIFYL